MPKRIQRRRSKGWRMPPNTIYVGRGSMYGNPFPVKKHGRDEAIAKFKMWLQKTPAGRATAEMAQNVLSGGDVACWCKEDEPCHGDVLLEIANKKWKRYHED